MTFLQREILEIFEEAQTYGRRKTYGFESDGLFRDNYVAWNKTYKAQTRLIDDELKERRFKDWHVVKFPDGSVARIHVAPIPPIAVETCACGAVLEWREGNKRPVHLGRCQI